MDADSDLVYFPSYEIMMDELRDYRFYSKDMIHPNETAIQYLWEGFTKAWISEDAFKTMNIVEEIQKGLSHKPFNPQSDLHLSFEQKLEMKKHQLQQIHPFIKF